MFDERLERIAEDVIEPRPQESQEMWWRIPITFETHEGVKVGARRIEQVQEMVRAGLSD